MQPETQAIRPASSPTALWIVAILLAVIATGLWVRPPAGWEPQAQAQGTGLAGARGVYAFTGQLDHEQYGLFMLDVDQGTIWCYAFEMVGGTRKLRLVAARSFIYDRYLQDFNNAPPDFRMVQQLVQTERAQASPNTPPPASNTGQPADGAE